MGDVLPVRVAEALERPAPGRRVMTRAADIPYSAIEWGDRWLPPLLLVHGWAASARTWWRVGPALAASGRRVIAVDQAGHGWTRVWRGHSSIRDNAADLAACVREAGWDRSELEIVGHSWGAITAAALVTAGIHPRVLVLLDPPVLSEADKQDLLSDPSETPYPDIEVAAAVLARAHPDWGQGDVHVKAQALVQVDPEAAREIILQNRWDGGLTHVADAVAAGVATWLIRSDPVTGGLLPDGSIPAFAALLGAERSITLAGAPHAPQRTHPVETTRTILDILGNASPDPARVRRS